MNHEERITVLAGVSQRYQLLAPYLTEQPAACGPGQKLRLLVGMAWPLDLLHDRGPESYDSCTSVVPSLKAT